ncbi:hypothetical protein BDN72DRAFT_916315, partial [Pluteus cervinus]
WAIRPSTHDRLGSILHCLYFVVAIDPPKRSGCFLEDNTFTLPLDFTKDPIDLSEDLPYNNQAICTILALVVFENGDDSIFVTYKDSFVHVDHDGEERLIFPGGLIALVTTAIYATLSRWKNGKPSQGERADAFSGKAFGSTYRRHLRKVDELESTDPDWLEARQEMWDAAVSTSFILTIHLLLGFNPLSGLIPYIPRNLIVYNYLLKSINLMFHRNLAVKLRENYEKIIENYLKYLRINKNSVIIEEDV